MLYFISTFRAAPVDNAQAIPSELQTVKCTGENGNYYQFKNNMLQLYPSPEIASFLDPSWRSAAVFDCKNLKKNDALMPPGQGQMVKCTKESQTNKGPGAIFDFLGNEIHYFPSDSSMKGPYQRQDVPPATIDCSKYNQGQPMA